MNPPRIITEADFDQLCENVRRRDQAMIDPVRGGRGCETPYRASGSRREPAIPKTTSRRSESAPSPLIQSFFLPGRLPGANDIMSRHRMVYARLKNEWGLTISRCIIVAKLKRMGYCRIEFLWQEPNNRRDDDNVIFGKKFVLDALKDTKIIQDDRRKFVHSTTDRVIVDPANPGVTVTLIAMEAQP